jgi:Xylose isomerase-like TIM barrel
MNSPLLAEVPPRLLDHHPLGASTGYMAGLRGDWPRLVDEASRVSSFAVELAALREDELPSLLDFLSSEPPLPFRYLSVHGPSKGRRMSEVDLVAQLAQLPTSVDAIVLHPDRIYDVAAYAQLGGRLAIENMDSRKRVGTQVEELEALFERLPEAGFCFDVAHAWTVDPTMGSGRELLDRFAPRLRHVHLSSISSDHKHAPLTPEHEELFAPLLSRCRDVPWILEAEPRLH